MKDPYLIKGQLCEVWNDTFENRCASYFHSQIQDKLYFCPKHSDLDKNDFQMKFKKYYPIGTEWDRGRFPEWAVCSVINNKGIIQYWNCIYSMMESLPEWGPAKQEGIYPNGGLCSDLTRWKGEAWKTSLRMKPDWAGVTK